jgi:deoxyribose-phosphate aldolase
MTLEAVAARVAGAIEHTLLDPGATAADLDRCCDEAVAHGFAAVCVNPPWVARCATRLAGTVVRVCTVAGFPLGAHLTEVKALEARRAVEAGAHDVDVMVDLGALREGALERVLEDLRAVVLAAAPATVKVILETGRLTDDEKRTGARLAIEAGARFVKTSTGFLGTGATIADVRLLRSVVGADHGVKASGGIRTLDQALELLEAGASRLGTSAGPRIVGAAAPEA